MGPTFLLKHRKGEKSAPLPVCLLNISLYEFLLSVSKYSQSIIIVRDSETFYNFQKWRACPVLCIQITADLK